MTRDDIRRLLPNALGVGGLMLALLLDEYISIEVARMGSGIRKGPPGGAAAELALVSYDQWTIPPLLFRWTEEMESHAGLSSRTSGRYVRTASRRSPRPSSAFGILARTGIGPAGSAFSTRKSRPSDGWSPTRARADEASMARPMQLHRDRQAARLRVFPQG